MQLTEVRRKAFAMPLNDPAYPPGPYKFYNREFVVITYRTDPTSCAKCCPSPLSWLGIRLLTNLSACRIQQALAITPKRVR